MSLGQGLHGRRRSGRTPTSISMRSGRCASRRSTLAWCRTPRPSSSGCRVRRHRAPAATATPEARRAMMAGSTIACSTARACCGRGHDGPGSRRPGVRRLLAHHRGRRAPAPPGPLRLHADESPIPGELLPPDLLVLDLIYNPTRTRLLREAASAGDSVMNGELMLLHQGAAAFTLWTGQPASSATTTPPGTPSRCTRPRCSSPSRARSRIRRCRSSLGRPPAPSPTSTTWASWPTDQLRRLLRRPLRAESARPRRRLVLQPRPLPRGGDNRTTDNVRMANLVQVSSASASRWRRSTRPTS